MELTVDLDVCSGEEVAEVHYLRERSQPRLCDLILQFVACKNFVVSEVCSHLSNMEKYLGEIIRRVLPDVSFAFNERLDQIFDYMLKPRGPSVCIRLYAFLHGLQESPMISASY